MAAGTGADEATHVIADSERLPRGSLAMVWWSLCSAMFYLFLGAAIALQYGTRNALIGAAIGVVTHGLLSAVFTRYAVRTGVSCFMLSRAVFGTVGATLTSLLFFLTMTYYAVFESAIVVVAAQRVFDGVNPTLVALVVVAYSVVFVAGGVQRWMDKFNGWLLPLYLGGLALISVLAIRQFGHAGAWLEIGPATPPPSTAWINCYMAFFGQQVLMMCTLDVARFGRREDERFHALVSFGWPFYAIVFGVNTVVGIFLAGVAGQQSVTETSVMDVCLTVLGGGIGLAFIWVTQTRINTANYVLSASNLQAVLLDRFGLRWHRLVCAAIVGVIVAVVITSTNILQYILIALSYQSIALISWVGVAFGYLTLPGVTTPEAVSRVVTESRSVKYPALVAWLASAVVGYWMLQLPGLPSALSVPASFLVAFLGYRLLRTRGAAVAEAAA